MTSLQPRRVLDPLYGRTNLSDFEFDLISLPEIQRLRYVRMCNINSLLITGASEISRFEHTLGVLRLAQEWLAANPQVSHDEAKCFTAAAVLHDAQTGPFGHSLQYVLVDENVSGDFSHDDLSHGVQSQYYQRIQINASFAGQPFGAASLLGPLWEPTSRLIRGEGRYGALIAGTMDIDNIDNVARLAYHAGLADKADAEHCLILARSLATDDGRLTLPTEAFRSVERWQDIRQGLYSALLLDWAEFSAKAMLTFAMEEAVRYRLLGSEAWILTDDELLSALEKRAVGESQAVADISRRLRGGALYHPVVLFESGFPSDWKSRTDAESKRLIELSLSRVAQTQFGMRTKILVHFIADKGKTTRAVPVVLREAGVSKVIGLDSNRMLVGVFSSKELSPHRRSDFVRAVYGALADAGFEMRAELIDPLEDESDSVSTSQMRLL